MEQPTNASPKVSSEGANNEQGLTGDRLFAPFTSTVVEN